MNIRRALTLPLHRMVRRIQQAATVQWTGPDPYSAYRRREELIRVHRATADAHYHPRRMP